MAAVRVVGGVGVEAVAALEPVAVQGLAGPVAPAGVEHGAEGAQLFPASLCQTPQGSVGVSYSRLVCLG